MTFNAKTFGRVPNAKVTDVPTNKVNYRISFAVYKGIVLKGYPLKVTH